MFQACENPSIHSGRQKNHFAREAKITQNTIPAAIFYFILKFSQAADEINIIMFM
jgi:hypothetical protein